MDSKVKEYFEKKHQWSKELALMRKILLEAPLKETIKWGAPTYTFNGKNIVGMAAYKNYCGLWFFQGALLKEKHNVLHNAQEGKTKVMLQWRFHTISEIDINLIKEYVLEAIENQKQGKEIKPIRKTKLLMIPELLQNELESNQSLKENFEKFSSSKKREYASYISEVKRETTKLSRLSKIIPMILNGAGLHDKYRNC